MSAPPYVLTVKTAAILVSIAAILTILGSTAILSASEPGQSSSARPEITGEQCSFGMDFNDDGEQDEPFGDAEADEHILQETTIAGGCTFQLNTPEAVTLTVGSELDSWEVEVKLQRQPNPADAYILYAGDSEISEVKGRMEVAVNFRRGDTPRSGRPRTLPDKYEHTVQIPREFRLLEVMAITPDGRIARLERNVRSASGTFIQVHRQMSDLDSEIPDWVAILSEEWLAAGYPQVAESVMLAATENGAGKSGINWWMVGFIMLLGILILVIAIVVVIAIKKESGTTTQFDSNL